MFLKELSSENKERFLKLCVHACMANGVIAQEEKNMVDAYCREMNMKEHIPDVGEDLSELLRDIDDNTTSAEKKIFVMEILALLKSDGEYDCKEKDFAGNFVHSLSLSDETLKKLNDLLDKYTLISKEIYEYIIK